MNFDPLVFWEQAKGIADESGFNQCALELFEYQSVHVPVYRDYLNLVKRSTRVDHFSKIPFLPVSLFKNHIVTDQDSPPELFFSSSGTTGQITSRHYIANASLYDQSLLNGFKYFFGEPSQYSFFALLPSYIERKDSSLIYMMQKLMHESGDSEGGFLLDDYVELSLRLSSAITRRKKIFLVGVTYALLDFFSQKEWKLQNCIIVETGGMKGRRKELVKSEVHEILCKQTGLRFIHSEYGMTELLSQAWSSGEGIFKCPPWMKVSINELHDPFTKVQKDVTGIINVIDLANIHSCGFIQTQDLGRMRTPTSFEVLGRMDHSELRGCNLMIG